MKSTASRLRRSSFRRTGSLTVAAPLLALGPFIGPLITARWLPLVIGSLTTALIFGLAARLHPAPADGFLASVVLSWYGPDAASQ